MILHLSVPLDDQLLQRPPHKADSPPTLVARFHVSNRRSAGFTVLGNDQCWPGKGLGGRPPPETSTERHRQYSNG